MLGRGEAAVDALFFAWGAVDGRRGGVLGMTAETRLDLAEGFLEERHVDEGGWVMDTAADAAGAAALYLGSGSHGLGALWTGPEKCR